MRTRELWNAQARSQILSTEKRLEQRGTGAFLLTAHPLNASSAFSRRSLAF
jgi:hypothetical protein